MDVPEAVQDSAKSSLKLAGRDMSEKLVHTLLLQECIPGTNTWNDSANLEDLEESELCRIFGLDPETLQENFGEIFSDILKFSTFLKLKIPKI